LNGLTPRSSPGARGSRGGRGLRSPSGLSSPGARGSRGGRGLRSPSGREPSLLAPSVLAGAGADLAGAAAAGAGAALAGAAAAGVGTGATTGSTFFFFEPSSTTKTAKRLLILADFLWVGSRDVPEGPVSRDPGVFLESDNKIPQISKIFQK